MSGELTTIPCPQCNGQGSVMYGAPTGGTYWSACDRCKGNKVLVVRILPYEIIDVDDSAVGFHGDVVWRKKPDGSANPTDTPHSPR